MIPRVDDAVIPADQLRARIPQERAKPIVDLDNRSARVGRVNNGMLVDRQPEFASVFLRVVRHLYAGAD